jgi:hypothetical protein
VHITYHLNIMPVEQAFCLSITSTSETNSRVIVQLGMDANSYQGYTIFKICAPLPKQNADPYLGYIVVLKID